MASKGDLPTSNNVHPRGVLLYWAGSKTLTGFKFKNHILALVSYTLYIKGYIVTCMSCVEPFATGIKIESSDQSPFGGPTKGSR